SPIRRPIQAWRPDRRRPTSSRAAARRTRASPRALAGSRRSSAREIELAERRRSVGRRLDRHRVLGLAAVEAVEVEALVVAAVAAVLDDVGPVEAAGVGDVEALAAVEG